MDAVRWAQHTALFLVLPRQVAQLQLLGTRLLLLAPDLAWAPLQTLGTRSCSWHFSSQPWDAQS